MFTKKLGVITMMNPLKDIAYNCRKATLLIEKKQLTSLTIRERFELGVHLSGCSACKIFQKQSILINQHLKKMFQLPSNKGRPLDDEYKETLQQKIDHKIK